MSFSVSYLCLVCLGDAQSRKSSPGYRVECPNCGTFGIHAHVVEDGLAGLSDEGRAKVSHFIRRSQRSGDFVRITPREFDLALSRNLPGVGELLENALVFVGTEQGHSPGRWIDINEEANLVATLGALTKDDVWWCMTTLEHQGLIDTDHGQAARLTAHGWSRFNEITRSGSASRRAFMAMKFDDPELDSVMSTCFRKAAARAGFDLTIVSQAAGLIDIRIQDEIRRSKFLVADLTHENPGAYWEAGFATGLGRPVIYTCRRDVFEGKGTHFDTSHHTTIPWSVDRLGEAEDLLVATIRETLPDSAKMDD